MNGGITIFMRGPQRSIYQCAYSVAADICLDRFETITSLRLYDHVKPLPKRTDSIGYCGTRLLYQSMFVKDISSRSKVKLG